MSAVVSVGGWFGTGAPRAIAAPDGNSTVSIIQGDGDVDGVTAGVEGVGCAAIASCSNDRTSSALAKSIGVCPSWFFKNGSAPCAN